MNNKTSSTLGESLKDDARLNTLVEQLKSKQRKVGEVIVRKEIETRMVQIEVPVRYEKLIVEQVSPEHKQLAEIDLGQEVVTGIELSESASQALEIDMLDKLADSNA